MDDAVYDLFNSKSEKNELSTFMISLAQQYLRDQYIEEQFLANDRRAKEYEKRLDNLYKKLAKIELLVDGNYIPKEDEEYKIVADNEVVVDGFEEETDLNF